jgi:tetratricopeptide (TPR) repeat protein
MADQGQFANAFSLLQNDYESASNCLALGYYWYWSIVYGELENDTMVSFRSSEKGIAKSNNSFEFVFESRNSLKNAMISCPRNGLVFKAAGLQSWSKVKKLSIEQGQELEADKAQLYFKKALEYGVVDSLTTYGLAEALEYNAKYAEAIRYYLKSYNINKNQVQALLKVSSCFGKINKWDSCYSYAHMAELRAENDEQLATAYRLKAESNWQGFNKKKDARKLFLKSLRTNPGNYDNEISYISFLQASRKYRKACKRATDLLENQPYHEHINVGLAYIFKYKQLTKIYNTAAERHGKESVIGAYILSNRPKL